MRRFRTIAAILLLVLGLAAVGPASPSVGNAGPPREAVPWRLVIYVDAALASDRSVEAAARALANEAGTLTGLGSVEIVLAAPEPEVRLGATRDPKLVAAALLELVHTRPVAGDLLWHRVESRESLAEASPNDSDGLRARTVASARTEQATIRGRLERLLAWLTESSPSEPGRPKAVLWVADGFDPRPVPFYSRIVPNGPLRASLPDALAPYDAAAAVTRLAEGLARAEWIALPLAPGLRPFGLSGGEDVFADPGAPLRRIAAATGGELMTGPELRRSLERLPGLRLRPGAAIGVAAPASTDAEAVYLLPLNESMVTGRTELAAQTLHPAVAAVAFRVGGEEVGVDRDPPFEIAVSLPMIPRSTVVEAVALDAAGGELGRDTMEVNGMEGKLRLAIREPRAIPGPGRYDVEVDVHAPKGAGIPAVELTWNGELLETLLRPPYRSSLTVPPDADGGYLQVIASLPDGRSTEAVIAMGQEGFGSRIAVDLVRLPTVVEDRRARPVPGLERGDFLVREEGREQILRDFGSAADTPLAVGLTVDVSTSLEEDLPLVREAATRFLRRVLRTGDRGQLVAFGGPPWLGEPLTRDPERLARAIERLSVVPNTALFDAIMLSLHELRGVDGRRAVVLLTDGRDTHSEHTFHQCSELARRAGIPIYVIVVGSPAIRSDAARLHRSLLARLAARTGGELHFVQRIDQLAAVYTEIAEELRHQYLLTYSPGDGDGASGWRRVEVEVLREGLQAKTVAGYFQGD